MRVLQKSAFSCYGVIVYKFALVASSAARLLSESPPATRASGWLAGAGKQREWRLPALWHT